MQSNKNNNNSPPPPKKTTIPPPPPKKDGNSVKFKAGSPGMSPKLLGTWRPFTLQPPMKQNLQLHCKKLHFTNAERKECRVQIPGRGALLSFSLHNLPLCFHTMPPFHTDSTLIFRPHQPLHMQGTAISEAFQHQKACASSSQLAASWKAAMQTAF